VAVTVPQVVPEVVVMVTVKRQLVPALAWGGAPGRMAELEAQPWVVIASPRATARSNARNGSERESCALGRASAAGQFIVSRPPVR